MKSTPLRRHTPMPARSAPIRKRASRPARRPAEYVDPPYLWWLRVQPCRVPGCGYQPSDPHHIRHDANGAALGKNVKDDRRAISLCRAHHSMLHTIPWVLRLQYLHCEVRAWQDQQLHIQRQQYLAGVGAAA